MYTLLFCETHDLVWEIISVSEKRMQNYREYVLLTMFSKNGEGGLFPLDAFFVRIRHLRPNRTIAESCEEGDGFE